MFHGEKFHGLTSFLSFPKKLSRLAVTLPILGTLDSNIHRKTFMVTKRSAKTAKLFHSETYSVYIYIYIYIVYININIIYLIYKAEKPSVCPSGSRDNLSGSFMDRLGTWFVHS